MSRDGKGELITKAIESDPVDPMCMDCGGNLIAHVGGRYRRCILGHVHCTRCKRQARKFRNNWTCGKCPGKQEK